MRIRGSGPRGPAQVRDDLLQRQAGVMDIVHQQQAVFLRSSPTRESARPPPLSARAGLCRYRSGCALPHGSPQPRAHGAIRAPRSPPGATAPDADNNAGPKAALEHLAGQGECILQELLRGNVLLVHARLPG